MKIGRMYIHPIIYTNGRLWKQGCGWELDCEWRTGPKEVSGKDHTSVLNCINDCFLLQWAAAGRKRGRDERWRREMDRAVCVCVSLLPSAFIHKLALDHAPISTETNQRGKKQWTSAECSCVMIVPFSSSDRSPLPYDEKFLSLPGWPRPHSRSQAGVLTEWFNEDGSDENHITRS